VDTWRELRAAALEESRRLRAELPPPLPTPPRAPAFLFTVTCPRCGRPLETTQVARTSGLRASVLLTCPGPTCQDQQALVQLIPVRRPPPGAGMPSGHRGEGIDRWEQDRARRVALLASDA
jgi:hypothetical protein